jgi:hypothetical protein
MRVAAGATVINGELLGGDPKAIGKQWGVLLISTDSTTTYYHFHGMKHDETFGPRDEEP